MLFGNNNNILQQRCCHINYSGNNSSSMYLQGLLCVIQEEITQESRRGSKESPDFLRAGGNCSFA
ncbi:hypothetical protein J6590_032878 [Homalodisca vitripennis]|nr:hypothetical protein J6590_032878 [Homalodisca vitripennis]